jgi:hypothetical protein
MTAVAGKAYTARTRNPGGEPFPEDEQEVRPLALRGQLPRGLGLRLMVFCGSLLILFRPTCFRGSLHRSD